MRSIIFGLALFPLVAFANCTSTGKTPLDEMLYMDKNELVSLHCSASASNKTYSDYYMKMLELGVYGGADFENAGKIKDACGADKKMSARVLKKDHGHEVTEADCAQLKS